MEAMASPKFAVDTNFLLDLAANNEVCWDCLDALKKSRRIPVLPQVVVTSTVLQELAYLVDNGSTADKRSLALKAMQNLKQWGITPLDLKPVGHGIVERIGFEIRRSELLPDEEANDSYVVAEAALVECQFLITSDGAILDLEMHQLKSILDGFHVSPLAVISPRKVRDLMGGR